MKTVREVLEDLVKSVQGGELTPYSTELVSEALEDIEDIVKEIVGEDIVIGKKEWARMSIGERDYVIGKNQDKADIRRRLKERIA